MQWGARAQFLEDMAAETGVMPAALVNRVDVRPDLLLYWQAFDDLSGARPVGFGGAGDIPWTALDQWATRHGVTGDMFDMLVDVVRRMDAAWLKWVNRKTRQRT